MSFPATRICLTVTNMDSSWAAGLKFDQQSVGRTPNNTVTIALVNTVTGHVDSVVCRIYNCAGPLVTTPFQQTT